MQVPQMRLRKISELLSVLEWRLESSTLTHTTHLASLGTRVRHAHEIIVHGRSPWLTHTHTLHTTHSHTQLSGVAIALVLCICACMKRGKEDDFPWTNV